MTPEDIQEHAARLVHMRQYSQAAAVLKYVVGISMTDGRAWMQLVRIYKSTRDFDQAEATLRQAIEACPDNARLRQALADLCREQRRYNEAREHFRRAMLLDPQMSSVYDSWGRMEMQLGRHPVAVSLIKRGLALKPSARLYHALGVMLDTQGRAGQAREMLRTGLKLPNEEGNPQLLHALGMVEVRAGDLPRARQAFLSAIASNPSFTMAHLSLGQLEEKLGNYEVRH
jgi:general transcriptional corepressor CYC8